MPDKKVSVSEGWTGPGRRDGQIEPLKLEEDCLHINVNKRGSYEWWYFDAHLDSGYTIVVFFHASNPNPGLEGKSGVEVVLVSPDGQRKQKFYAHPKKEFSAARDMPSVKIGENSIQVEQQGERLPVYVIDVNEPGFGCHLTYRAKVKGWKPGSGLSTFGHLGYFAWIVPFARAAVEGTITDGDQTTAVTGVGYHDHNWLNFPFPRMIEYWMWGRIYSKSFTAAYAFIKCNQKADYHDVKVLMLAKGPEVILSTGEFTFTKEDYYYNESAHYYFPSKITIHAPPAFTAILRVKKVLEAQDMLENYHPLLRFIARNVLKMKPGYFRLVSDFELEVVRRGKCIHEAGTTLHEIVLFKRII